jgi:hypothetical protein
VRANRQDAGLAKREMMFGLDDFIVAISLEGQWW